VEGLGAVPPRAISQAITEFEFHMSIEHPLCESFVIGQAPRAVNGLVDVGDSSGAPALDLIAEDPKPARPADSDRTLGDNTAPLAAVVTDRRLLDDEPCRRDTDFER